MEASEKVAILTAMDRKIKEALKSARSELDAQMLDAYEDSGIINRELRVCGERVGKITMRMSKPEIDITDLESLIEFGMDYGFAHEVNQIRSGCEFAAVEYLKEHAPELTETVRKLNAGFEKDLVITRRGVEYMDSGMIVPGTEVVPSQPKNTAVTGCLFADVSDIVLGLPGGFNTLLLEA